MRQKKNEPKNPNLLDETHNTAPPDIPSPGGHRGYGPHNPHPLSLMKTELVWDGKYDEYGNRRQVDVAACAMPMQKIETVDEPRQRAEADGSASLALFEKVIAKTRRDDFRNRLVWGDNKLVMASLLKEFKGKIDLIYIDPPFDVGADFTGDRRQGSVHAGDGRLPRYVGQGDGLVSAYDV